MTTTTHGASLVPVEKKAPGRQRILTGIYWHEWFSHGSQMLFVLSAWLIGQWVLEIFNQPMWVIVWGSAMGMWLGITFAGGDALEATEEFVLALPAVRAQRYIARLVISLSFLSALVGVSLLAIAFNWPQAAWSLFVETGLTTPFREIRPEWDAVPVYQMAIGCPLAVYGVTFGFAAMATSRDQVTLGGLLGLVYTVAAVPVGLAIESWWYRHADHKDTLTVAFAIQLVMAISLLLAGYFGYKRKDGISRPRGLGTPEWRMTFIVSAGLMLLSILVIAVVAYVEASR